jgi:predicted lipoprotein with Yx(FWY)xxD motif
MEPYATSTPYQPFNESEVAAHLSSVPLEGGDYQYVWKDKKLFTYKADQFPNDFLGDGLDNDWTLARP